MKKEFYKQDSLDVVGELLKSGMYVAVDDLDSDQYCGNFCTDPMTGKVQFS